MIRPDLPPIPMRRLLALLLVLPPALPVLGGGITHRGQGGKPAEGTQANLPYRVPTKDLSGISWMVYPYMLRQQGNAPAYQTAAYLNVNGREPNYHGGPGRIDENGDIVIESLNGTGWTATRRVSVDAQTGAARVLDIFRNTGPREQTLSVLLRSNTGSGFSSHEVVRDPARKGREAAWAAVDSRGKGLAEVFAGRGARTSPTFEIQPGNNQLSATFTLTIAAGKEAALVHLHAHAGDFETALEEAKKAPASLGRGIPAPIRRILANGSGGPYDGPEHDLARGAALDLLETVDGTAFRGTVRAESFTVRTDFGNATLPAGLVAGVVRTQEALPRDVLVTRDGDYLCGRLAEEKIAFVLSNNEPLEIPAAKLARLGLRLGKGEPKERAEDRPTVWTAAGDRIGIEVPKIKIEAATRYGRLSLAPEAVSHILFREPEQASHQIILSDGSRISGIVETGTLECTVAGTDPPATLKIPAPSLACLFYRPPAEGAGEGAAAAEVSGGDELIGSISADLSIETSLKTLTFRASEVAGLAPVEGSPAEFEAVLSDESRIRGRLAVSEIPFNLKCGIALKLPAAVLRTYRNPEADLTAALRDRVDALVQALNADAWGEREEAEQSLKAIGPGIFPALRRAREGQPLEAQQRIDRILGEEK